MQNLIVVRPFGPHRPGDAISEPGEVAGVLASEHAGHVVRCEGVGGAPVPATDKAGAAQAPGQAPAQAAVPAQGKTAQSSASQSSTGEK